MSRMRCRGTTVAAPTALRHSRSAKRRCRRDRRRRGTSCRRGHERSALRSLAFAFTARRRLATNAASSRRRASNSTRGGSPAYASRSANASFFLSTNRWMRSASPTRAIGRSSLRRSRAPREDVPLRDRAAGPKTHRPRYSMARGRGDRCDARRGRHGRSRRRSTRWRWRNVRRSRRDRTHPPVAGDGPNRHREIAAEASLRRGPTGRGGPKSCVGLLIVREPLPSSPIPRRERRPSRVSDRRSKSGSRRDAMGRRQDLQAPDQPGTVRTEAPCAGKPCRMIGSSLCGPRLSRCTRSRRETSCVHRAEHVAAIDVRWA